jgi:Protein of unknown function (DUF2752)
MIPAESPPALWTVPAVPDLASARPQGWVRYTPLLILAVLGAAFVYILADNPTDQRPDLLGGCGWYLMFHTNGPTCGGTRMVWYLLHGNLVGAARSHLPALIGVPFALYALTAWTTHWVFGLRLPRLRLHWAVYVGYAVFFVVFAVVLRNLPGFGWFHLGYMQPGIGL